MDDLDQPQRGSPQPLPGRCGRRLSRTDPPRYCAKYPIQGRDCCQMHGGNNAVGLDSPNTRTGRWSKALPAQLQGRYDELLADREYLNLGHDIGLLDVRLQELLERLDRGESEVGWERAREAFADLRTGMAENDLVAIRASMQRLNEILNGGARLDQTWRDIREGLQERRLLVESERRRLVDMHQMVTVEEVLLLVTAIGGVIQRHVEDPDDRRRIANEIQVLLGPGGTRAAQALASGRRTQRVASTTRSIPNAER